MTWLSVKARRARRWDVGDPDITAESESDSESVLAL